MALNDAAVVTAAQGFVFTAPVGTAAPTPTELDTVNPELFGALVKNVKITGSPTGGTFTLTVGTATGPIAYNATKDQVKAALEALASVGVGNVSITGTSLTDASGYDVAFVGALHGTSVTLTGTGTGLTGGTTPTVVIGTTTALNGWTNVGHTSRDDMPEFGFDGGDTEVKGTWQKKRLREVATGDPVADSVAIKLSQWDKTSLELYYGVDTAATTGVFGVSGDFAPLEKALLVIIVDGSIRLGFYSPKSSIKRDDSVELPVDEFATLPIKATFLNLGASRLYDWISKDLFV